MKAIIKLSTQDETIIIPKYETEYSSGIDLRSNEDLFLYPGEYRAIKTGLRMEIPEGIEGQIRSRSGLAAKFGIHVMTSPEGLTDKCKQDCVFVLNQPGTIDSDYRGEIMVILKNSGYNSFEIKKGDRIAQMVFAKFERVNLMVVDQYLLSETGRGAGGLGSTGMN